MFELFQCRLLDLVYSQVVYEELLAETQSPEDWGQTGHIAEFPEP